MKAIVESPLTNPYLTDLFVSILNNITTVTSEDELRSSMKIYDKVLNGLEYGFGAHHMWVSDSKSKQRLIFVEF